MTTSNYKNPRTSRQISEQTSFNRGIMFTDHEVPAGNARMLINYDFADRGQTLKPRKGFSLEPMLLTESAWRGSQMFNTDMRTSHVHSFVSYHHVKSSATTPKMGAISTGFGSPFGNHLKRYVFPEGATIDYDFAAWEPFNTVSNGVGFTVFRPDFHVILESKFGSGVLVNQFEEAAGVLARYHEDPEKTFGLIRAKLINRPGTYVDYSNGNLTYPAYFDPDYIYNSIGARIQQEFPAQAVLLGNTYAIATRHFDLIAVAQVTEVQDGYVEAVNIDGEPLGSENTPWFKLCKVNHECHETVGGSKTILATREVVEAYQPNPMEAAMSGFNLLLNDPYDFPNQAGNVDALGILPYAVTTTAGTKGPIRISSHTGEKIRFVLTYGFEAGQSHQFKWEWKRADSDTYTTLQDWTAQDVGATTLRYIDFAPPSDAPIIIQAQIRKGTDANTVRTAATHYTSGIESLRNVGEETQVLTTATGMFTYQDRLGLYGVKGSENAVFLSMTEDPGYFPVPHGVEYYDTEVLHVLNYLDGLIIITRDAIIYQDSAHFKKVFTGLHISDLDAKMAQVIKDQVFLKIGTDLYIVKPNAYTSDASDLKAFKISDGIEDLLVQPELLKVSLEKLYGEDSIRIIQPQFIKTYMVGNELYMVYSRIYTSLVRETADPEDEALHLPDVEQDRTVYLDVVFKYDTLSRAWTVYTADHAFGLDTKPYITNDGVEIRYVSNYDTRTTYEANSRIHKVVQQNVKDTVVGFDCVVNRDLEEPEWVAIPGYGSATYSAGENVTHIQSSGADFTEYLEYNMLQDTYVRILRSFQDPAIALVTYVEPNYIGVQGDLSSEGGVTIETSNTTEPVSIILDDFEPLHNWQMLDTGVLPLATSNMKRLRELQIVLNNNSDETIQFSSDIFLDNRDILRSIDYVIEHDTDPESPTFGHIYIDPRFRTSIEGVTKLDTWAMDFARFPDITLLTAHLQLLGRGKYIRGVFINKDERAYAIDKLIWVYRIMSAR